MKKSTKIWLLIAASFTLMGCILFWCMLNAVNWDFSKLETINRLTNSYAINENYKNISITTDTAHIAIETSENNNCSVVCYEYENSKHRVNVIDDTLTIKIEDTRKWYEYLGISFSTPKITVYIPRGEYNSLTVNSDTSNIEIPDKFLFNDINVTTSTGFVNCYASADKINLKTTTGRITVKRLTTKSMNLSASTGSIMLTGIHCSEDINLEIGTGEMNLIDVKCRNLFSQGDTGDIFLKNIIGEDKFQIERDTGDVNLKDCDAGEIYVETDTGDVTGNLLTDKIFFAQTNTGRINVPKTTNGGICEITTDTGDIKINITD